MLLLNFLLSMHEYLDLVRMSLVGGEREEGERYIPIAARRRYEFDLLTCIDDAIENALGWSMGMRSNRYGNGMLALDEGKSLKTSRIVLLGLLQ